MDYTTLAITKEALRVKEDVDDNLLVRVITAASRAVDKACGGSQQAANYFELETIANEEIKGQMDVAGKLLCWPHKSIIQAVTALSYRFTPLHGWTTVEVSRLTTDGRAVTAWTYLNTELRGPCFIRVSYTGGHAALVSDLPEDFVEAVSLLAARFYREAETGLTDSIGVAELGTLTYTKAWPQRARDMLFPYTRRVPW